MLQLLNPIWLFGIGGILIPLIIHLWNVKTGRTLKVGSITLMGESSRQNSRSLKLTDLLLLFFRCLLIILLSVLLAEPVWKSSNIKNENKTWVLIEKDAFRETYSNFKNEIDSLISSGSELHLFQPGFQKTKLEIMAKDTVSAATTEKNSYWSLVRLMEQQIPQGFKAFIFTDDRLNRFNGLRPATATAIHWKTYTPSDSTSRWIDQAYLTSSGDIRAVVSESNPRGTLRKIIAVNPGTDDSGIKTSVSNGKLQLQLNSQKITVDTSTLTIAINAEGFAKDAEYLNSAIIAIQKYTLRKIRLVKPSDQHDIIFWLSSKSLPSNTAKIINPGSIVFQYANGKAVSIKSWLEITNGLTFIRSEKIPLHKRIDYPEKDEGFTIWEDGFGQPILHLKQQNEISIFTFYSRFDPEWTDLVWSPEFVKMLMPLIIPEVNSFQEEKFDKRSINSNEILPSSDLRPHASEPSIVKKENLKPYLWFILMIVFLTERYITFKNDAI